MPRNLLPFLLMIVCAACANDKFDDSAIPEDQLSTELAFKRMADHGELEPVLEVGQMIDGWQFYVLHVQQKDLDGKPTPQSATLQDRTGVAYNVTAENSPEVIKQLEVGTLGFARGRIHRVERDLAAGNMSVELLLNNWTVTEK